MYLLLVFKKRPPVKDEDIRQTITRIEQENPTSNMEFWELLLGN